MTLLVFDFELPPRVCVWCDASDCCLHGINNCCHEMLFYQNILTSKRYTLQLPTHRVKVFKFFFSFSKSQCMCAILCNTFSYWLKEKKVVSFILVLSPKLIYFKFYIHKIKCLSCRSCPAAVCSRHRLCSCTVRTWCLQRRSWNSVRGRRVTATRRMAKTVTAPSCWSMPALAMHTGYFSTDGWRRASAVRSAWGECTCLLMYSKDFLYFVSLCVPQSPSVQLGWSTVSAPSPVLQPAIASTSKKSARRSVWTAARVPVATRLSLRLWLFVSVLVVVVTLLFFSGEGFGR